MDKITVAFTLVAFSVVRGWSWGWKNQFRWGERLDLTHHQHRLFAFPNHFPFCFHFLVLSFSKPPSLPLSIL